MNREELNQWLASGKFVDTIIQDDPGNEWRTTIVEHDGKLYALEFCNGVPCKLKGQHDGKNAYGPVEVIKKTRMVEQTYYEDSEGCKYVVSFRE